MSNETKLPDFDDFSRWLTARVDRPTIRRERHDAVIAAAREARDEFVLTRRPAQGSFEVLQLLAAADKSDTARPPEMTTARGFHVTLAYDEGTASAEPSICVLVRSPPELVPAIEGQFVYLWNGAQRFELGQFDAEGKAIGILPAGIQISVSDFTQGRVKLEEPPAPAG